MPLYHGGEQVAKERSTEAIWNDKIQRWQIRVNVDGERRSFYSSKANGQTRKGKLEAEHKADAWLRSQTVNDRSIVKEMAAPFLGSIRSRSEQSYISCEKYMRLYIIPVIGLKRVSQLTELDLQRVIDIAYEGRHLSRKTLQNISSCLMAFVKFCRKAKVTDLHPEDPPIIPRAAAVGTKTILDDHALRILFTDDSTHKFTRHQIRNEISDPYIWRYRMAVVYGFRPGELSGLMWDDIKDGVIRVRRSYNTRNEMTQGKNDNARRVEIVTPTGQWILDGQKALCEEKNIQSVYIFPNMRTGDVCTQKVAYDAYKRYCEHHGITEGATPYELRHTFCSINDEMPDYLKQQVMGHSAAMNTNKQYGHRKTSDMEKIAGYIENTISQYRK